MDNVAAAAAAAAEMMFWCQQSGFNIGLYAAISSAGKGAGIWTHGLELCNQQY